MWFYIYIYNHYDGCSNTCEETQIKRMLQNYDKWENDMSKFLDVYSSYSLSYNSNEFTGNLFYL